MRQKDLLLVLSLTVFLVHCACAHMAWAEYERLGPPPDTAASVSVPVTMTEVTYRTHGLNFSPYIDDDEDPERGGAQITDEELEERLAIIAPYTEWIRTFGCNDDLREAGMFAHAMGLKAAVGAWLGQDSAENQRQIDCLVDVARAGHADLAIVGSEVLLRGDLSEGELIAYINQAKDRLKADPAVNIPVTTADTYTVLLSRPNVLSAVDLVFGNFYPYWEGRNINEAVRHLDAGYQRLTAEAGGKEVIVSETGWPSCGNHVGEAEPSPENASFYFLHFVSWARAKSVKYFYFEAFDEGWKTKREGPQGACWGIWDKDGDLKPGMQDVFDGRTIYCNSDFDGDGDADGSDLAVFAAEFGRTDCDAPPPCKGDFDSDGDVDGTDLAVFAKEFGRTDCR